MKFYVCTEHNSKNFPLQSKYLGNRFKHKPVQPVKIDDDSLFNLPNKKIVLFPFQLTKLLKFYIFSYKKISVESRSPAITYQVHYGQASCWNKLAVLIMGPSLCTLDCRVKLNILTQCYLSQKEIQRGRFFICSLFISLYPVTSYKITGLESNK